MRKIIVLIALTAVLAVVFFYIVQPILKATEILVGAGETKVTAITPVFEEGVTNEEKLMLLTAKFKLEEYCQPLFTKYAGDIESIKLESWGYSADFYHDNYGWKNVVVADVKIKRPNRHIPKSFYVHGSNLQYYMGTGFKSGILASKPQAVKVCHWSDEFVSVPELNHIK